MAAPHRKTSSWFKHPAGFGWKCQACGIANSPKIRRCRKCRLLKVHTMEDRIQMMEKQG